MATGLSPEAFSALGTPHLVYIRPVLAEDLLARMPPEMREECLPFSADLHGVYRADGTQLAVVPDRETAIAEALAHGLDPVSVH